MTRVFLLDGTYELFRQFFGRPGKVTDANQEVSAVQGVLGSVLGLIETGVTHIGVATDHVIESFRNGMWPGYKTGEGVASELKSQFPLLEEALTAMGVTVWPMVDMEADDGLASAARIAARDKSVEQVVILTPDKDLAQCVLDGSIVQVDRRTNKVFDEAGVIEKFGVTPASIPDYLALVGDSADGFPGIPGWGAKTTAAVLREYEHLESIPKDGKWNCTVRGAPTLAANLFDQWDHALLFRDLATLRDDRELFSSVEELRWKGPTEAFGEMCERLESPRLVDRAAKLIPA